MAVFVLGLAAACCLGFGFVLQQRAAQRAPLADFLSFRLLLDLLRMPEWVLGIALMVGGQVLGALALAHGEVSLVEPLTATNLLFAMALSRRLTGQPLGRSGWGGVGLLAAGVTAFIVAGRPSGGGAAAGPLRHWLLFGLVVGIALLLTALGRRLRPTLEATVLALAAGLLYGLQDALTRICGQIVDDHGATELFVHWQPYVIVAIGLTGLLLVQSAFETAPLRSSLPALTAAQPLAGIACGVGFLGDRLRVTTEALTWQTAGLAAIVAGIVLLGRHPAMPEGPCAQRDPKPSLARRGHLMRH
ncbi:DMT family transporter [Streptomyces sp. SL13]|uniref:DMT family transporter n=1 Tax=Streptantibioticus silvisoli TaxID=2705255 RepID=A0AA90HAH4_9ACTN|nr:DMT family transporter [Streptantibioticus silvisoli]MDI5967091.1 DMT family transporter [Streptantibioticus silvisoli]MDI5974245.1 DMT family transporter [Streptantibioticus silvisoli]